MTRELAAAVGLAGRDRKAASSTERARISVTKAIKATIKKIDAHNPALADHLRRAVKTGYFCSYMLDTDSE